nr:MAG TPA: hypothetical protein [Caudoviricetes sp.]
MNKAMPPVVITLFRKLRVKKWCKIILKLQYV